MALYRNEPIEHIVDMLDLALPDKKDTLVAKSAIAQARRRLTEEPLAYLFATTAAEWAKRSADARKWRGLSLYGLDGTTIRVPDSPENRAAFGGSYAGALRGESGYPQVRAVAVMALRSHVMSAFRFADYATGETTLGARCLERSAGGLTRDRGPQLPWSRTSSFTSRAAAIATGCRGRRRERATRSSKS